MRVCRLSSLCRVPFQGLDESGVLGHYIHMGLNRAELKWPRRLFAMIGVAVIGASASAIKAPDLEKGETGFMKSVVDGDTLFMDGGLKVRLAGMQAPKLPLGRAGFTGWPLGEAAKSALYELTEGRAIGLYYSGLKRDRYKRALAQVYTLDEQGMPDIWVQEAMISQGLARVYTWPDTVSDNRLDVQALYKAERKARAEGRGIWALEYYKIRKPDPDPLAQDVDSFQIVEGIITSVADIRGQIYLNFGANYRTDFTIAIVKSSKKRFKKAGLDPLGLEGATVRVRGWIELQNGPVIWLDHPERLEILDAINSG